MTANLESVRTSTANGCGLIKKKEDGRTLQVVVHETNINYSESIWTFAASNNLFLKVLKENISI